MHIQSLVLSILTLVQTDFGLGQTTAVPSLFQCQSSPSQESRVFLPNISSSYFQPQNIASDLGVHLATLIEGVTYVYPVNPVVVQPSCSGTVVAVEYCHQESGPGAMRDIFTLLSVTEDNDTFTISRKFTVQQSNLSTCVSVPASSGRICCDRSEIAENQYQIPSRYRFAVTASNGLLGFTTSSTLAYVVSLGNVSTFILSPAVLLSGIPLLRIFIEPAAKLATTDQTTKASEATPELTTVMTTQQARSSIELIGGVTTAAAAVALLLIPILLVSMLLLRKRARRKSSPTSSQLTEQQVQLTQNIAYVPTPSIPLETNECYGTTTTSYQLYAIPTCGEKQLTLSSHAQQEPLDYDYVM